MRPRAEYIALVSPRITQGSTNSNEFGNIVREGRKDSCSRNRGAGDEIPLIEPKTMNSFREVDESYQRNSRLDTSAFAKLNSATHHRTLWISYFCIHKVVLCAVPAATSHSTMPLAASLKDQNVNSHRNARGCDPRTESFANARRLPRETRNTVLMRVQKRRAGLPVHGHCTHIGARTDKEN